MSERDLVVRKPEEVSEWDGATVTRDISSSAPRQDGAIGWVGVQLDRAVARFLDVFARRGPLAEGEPAALARTGGPLARWISFPRGVRVATAATTTAAAGLAAWGVLAMAGNEFGVAVAAAAAATALSAASGPLGVRLANRLHRLIARHRRYHVSELRAIADRKAVAVRGVVVSRRTAA